MQIYDLWKETHPDYKTVHTPLLFRKIVGIEDFALRAAIFLGWVSKLLSGGGGGTLKRKTIRYYEKSTRLRTNSFERMEINPNSIKYAIL